MTMDSLHVLAAGMYCAVGLNCDSASAALRAGLDNFRAIPFYDYDGTPLNGAIIDGLPEDGTTRLVGLVRPALKECLASFPLDDLETCALVLLLDEDLEDPESLFQECVCDMEVHPKSRICPLGKGGIGPALDYARSILHNHTVEYVLLAGVSSCFINEKTERLQAAGRILTSMTNHGFIPGEGAGAVLLSLSQPGQRGLHIKGTGYAQESGHFLQEALPNKATAMTTAIRIATTESGHPVHETCFYCGDCSGEYFFSREISIALTRCMQQPISDYPHFVPAYALGETGAAVGPIILSYMTRLLGRPDGFGQRALLHFSSDSGVCAAFVCEWIGK